ncbi:hypothetical protein [Streptomyces sp. cg35]|uniref:hypothetical protein n=1 Tax=Streptomyces sp. cg35 TaxID=3421650 RepID=UPI003D164852
MRQYLRAGLAGEMRLAIVPLLADGGERLLDHVGDGIADCRVAELVGSDTVAPAALVRH